MAPSNPRKGFVTVLASGGIDSFALCHLLRCRSFNVSGLFIDYGQAAREPEWSAIGRQAKFLSIDVQRINCQTTSRFGSGELTGRNSFLVTAAAFFARPVPDFIGIGVHAGVPYYDCSMAFIDRLKPLVEEQSSGRVSVLAPFIDWHKPQIVAYLRDSGLPLDATYSCESGSIPPCATCASCRDRGVLGC